jgi:MFS family permease
MSTVASLPFFLFTLPAGALADRVDRQKLVCTINVCMAATALTLAVLGWMHLLSPCLILGGVFFTGVGFAINAPAWASIVRQVVSDGELPSAATLGSLQFSIAGIIGPVLGGLLAFLAGASFVFALNAACFLLVVVATRQWKQPTPPAKLPSESFFESFGTIFRYVRNAPGFQAVLARNFLFALFISVIPALMPVVGLKVLHLSSSNLGLLFTSMGVGSVVGAVFILPWLRARLSPNCLTLSANLLLVLVYLSMALVRQTEVFFAVAALAGVGWTTAASELWVAAQRAMPSWAQGRLNATVIMISQGAMALGGVIWGSAGAIAGTSYTLLGAALLFLASLFPARRLSINLAGDLEERVSGILPVRIEPKEATSIPLERELLAA